MLNALHSFAKHTYSYFLLSVVRLGKKQHSDLLDTELFRVIHIQTSFLQENTLLFL